MPKPALSLVAFHGQEKTFEYLQQMCILDDSSPQALQQHFNHANSQLGPAFVNAGCPEVIDLPTEYQPYCHAVLNSPPAKALEQFGSMTIRLIEIAPLLATQHHIELDRASSLYCSTGKVPDIAEMLPVCLPIGPQNISLEPSRPQTPLSWTLRTPSLNFRITGGGLFPLESGDIYFGAKLALAHPLVWVTQYDGKSQLNNGYHRSYSL